MDFDAHQCWIETLRLPERVGYGTGALYPALATALANERRADAFAHPGAQKNKEASTDDHRPKHTVAVHAWEVTPSRSATISMLPLKAASRVASIASSG